MKERFKIFTVLVSKINRMIKKIKAEEMAEFELKSPHVSCLYYIYNMRSLTAKQLCDICEEDKAAVSRSIEYLEEKGYLECKSITAKRYKSPLTLTSKGMEIGKLVADKIDSMLEVASDGIKESDRIIMYRCLMLISDNLQKICEKYGD